MKHGNRDPRLAGLSWASTTRKTAWQAVILAAVLLGPAVAPAAAQPNVGIESWSPPGSVRSPWIRILDPATTLPGPAPDYFGETEVFSTDKTQNAIYVRFENRSLAVIPDGAVTVGARFAPAAPNIAPGAVVAQVPAAGSPLWEDFGSYTMSLVIPAGAGPDYGLTPGFYPTTHELASNNLYRILCSTGCSTPMPASFFLEIRLVLAGDSDTSDNRAIAYYDRGVPPADVVLLHDVSGSMHSQLAIAQDRARFFVDLLNVGDRVGVVAFSGNLTGGSQVLKSLGTPLASLAATDSAKSQAFTAIGSFNAGGLTPMGAGVITARDVLNDLAAQPYPQNRAIVMLTDGRENVSPYIDEPSYAILNSLNSSTPQIGLYPLWFGTTSHWGLNLLQTIETHVAVRKLVDQPSDPLELAKAYLMVRGILTSDDVYAIHRGIEGDSYVGTIDVDAITYELILAVAWNSFGRELRIEVQRPGDSSWQPAGPISTHELGGQTYVVYRIDNPVTGQWRYRLASPVQTRRPEEYVISALADQVDVLMQSSLADNSVAAGEPITINARLSRGGQGVPGKVVRATVQTPDRALGTILHQYRDKLQTPVPGPATPVDQPRAAGIAQELQSFLGSQDLFQYSPGTIALTDNGDGTYSGQFTNTNVAGTYKITILAESQAGAATDGFRREHLHSAVVSLGPIDPDNSIVNVKRVGGEERAVWQVTAIPVDVYGNFANPGYGGVITFATDAGSWIDTATVDLDDGSYTRRLELDSDQAARVTATAFGQTVGKVTANPDAGGGGWSLSLHSGGSFPTGTFGDAFDPGPSFLLDLEWELKPRLTAMALAGVHDFPGVLGVPSETVTQLSANLRWRFTPATLSPYIQGGPGAYDIFGSWEPGANLGLGLTFRVSPTIDVEGGVDYHSIQLAGPDAEFWQLHTGFSIRY